MGLLVDGEWRDKWYDTESNDGKFKRQESAFRDWLTAHGEPGPDGQDAVPAATDRYHLYVSLACPWAHRVLIFRKLKGLESALPLSVVHPFMGEQGWTFKPGRGVVPDPLMDADYLHQIYTAARSDYSGRVTVPVLWDKQRGTIVNNESSELIRMLNSAFDHLGATAGDYYPEPLRDDIDRINDFVYTHINNGVYKAGFATSQSAYEKAVYALFDALDHVEHELSRQRYLAGDRLTEADWRLFTTLIRFDVVYHGHFKCNIRRIVDYPQLSNYLRDLYQVPGVADTVDLESVRQHYYQSHDMVNPTRVVAVGPDLDLDGPHDRGRFGS